MLKLTPVYVDGGVAIPLTKGKWAIVDEVDWSTISQYKWSYVTSSRHKTGYAQRTQYVNVRRTLQMHRVILGDQTGPQTDHIDGNGLNNRRSNLRVATSSQNRCNTSRDRRNSSGFKGVSRHSSGLFQVEIKVNGRRVYGGLFQDPQEASRVRDELAVKYHKEFANLNWPEREGDQ